MKITKLPISNFHEDAALAAKINEVIDEMNRRDNNTASATYETPGPSPYDLSAWPRKDKPLKP